jgi:hypothetical protein
VLELELLPPAAVASSLGWQAIIRCPNRVRRYSHGHFRQVLNRWSTAAPGSGHDSALKEFQGMGGLVAMPDNRPKAQRGWPPLVGAVPGERLGPQSVSCGAAIPGRH